MTNKTQYKSEALGAIHETINSLHQAGIVDKKTLRNFDVECLEITSKIEPKEIKELREREQVSQPVFAKYLNVSRNLVSDWERGVKKPSGSALRLITIIKKYGLNALT